MAAEFIRLRVCSSIFATLIAPQDCIFAFHNLFASRQSLPFGPAAPNYWNSSH